MSNIDEALHDGDRNRIYELMNQPGFDVNERSDDGYTPIESLIYEVNITGDLKNYMDVYLEVLTSFMNLNPSPETVTKALEVLDECLDEHSNPSHPIHISLQQVKEIIVSEEDPENVQGGGRKKKGKKSRKGKKTRKGKKSRKVKKTRKGNQLKKSKKSKKTRRH
jgi:hypothetical protein